MADALPVVMSKTCARCGRRIEWRRKWAANWDEIRFCSARCRGRRRSVRDRVMEDALIERAARAAAGATFCPSEVARALDPEGWRERMEPIREAARRLIARGELEMLQQGRVVDPSSARGPIRLRRASRAGGPRA